MAASFTLTLDTTPPQVSFGYTAQPLYGHDFSLPVTVNEPQIESAELVAYDGQRWPLIHRIDGTLWRYITEEVVLGPAVVEVRTRDEVGNFGLTTHFVQVGGLSHIEQSDRSTFVTNASDFSEVLPVLETLDLRVKTSSRPNLATRTSDHVSILVKLDDSLVD